MLGAVVDNTRTVDQQLSRALKELKRAIELLDRASAPTQIAAHVDLAVHQLRDLISTPNQRDDQIDTNAEPQ